MNPLPYRTALVTGASSGIGAALAKRLASRGVEVVISARRVEALEGLATEIGSLGGKAHVVPLDVTDAHAVMRVLADMDDRLGGLDLVVANAGVASVRSARRLRYEHCEPVVAVNVTGALATLTALLPRMIERKRGHLVGISSLACLRGLPRRAVYSASKAFLSTFLEGLRVETEPLGVFVTDVRPGYVRTPMVATVEHTMPFVLDAEQAAHRILSAVVKRRSVVAFPWQPATMMKAVRILPGAVYAPIARRSRWI